MSIREGGRERSRGRGDIYSIQSLKHDGIGIFEYRQTVMLFFLKYRISVRHDISPFFTGIPVF